MFLDAVAITGPSGPSVDEELDEDTIYVDHSGVLIAATVVGDEEQLVSAEELLQLRADREKVQNAPVAQVVRDNTRCERVAWTGAITKRRFLAALIALLLVAGCAVAGALLAANKSKPDGIKGHVPPAENGEDPTLYTDIVRAQSNEGDRFAEFVVISRDGTTIASGAEVGNYVQVYRLEGTSWNQIGPEAEWNWRWRSVWKGSRLEQGRKHGRGWSLA